MRRKAQSPVGEQVPTSLSIPSCDEAERGLASIALNHPSEFLHASMEARLSPADFQNPLCKQAVEVVLEQTTRNASCDLRIVFEKLREKDAAIELYQLSELYQLMPIAQAMPDFINMVRAASKRRALLMLAYQACQDAQSNELPTSELVARISMQVDELMRETTPPKAMDTKSLLVDAARRYQEGDDSSMRISTGYKKLDDICPIRYGDYVVIGGETKSGKTMLALNIISNLLTK
jgi:replicative DNA helicase